jgi:hypothetical protein
MTQNTVLLQGWQLGGGQVGGAPMVCSCVGFVVAVGRDGGVVELLIFLFFFFLFSLLSFSSCWDQERGRQKRHATLPQMEHKHTIDEYRLALWLNAFHRYQRDQKDSRQSFEEWLEISSPKTVKTGMDRTCFLPPSMKSLYLLQSCPEDDATRKTVDDLLAADDPSMLQTWKELHRLRRAQNDVSLMVLDRQEIPSELLHFLSQDLIHRVTGCGLHAGYSPDLLYIVWHGNVPEGVAAVELKSQQIKIDAICTRQERKHTLKVGTLLIEQIRRDFPATTIVLDAVPESLGFYLRIGFVIDYPKMLSQTENKDQRATLEQLARLRIPLSTENQRLVAATFKKWRRVWRAFPMRVST